MSDTFEQRLVFGLGVGGILFTIIGMLQLFGEIGGLDTDNAVFKISAIGGPALFLAGIVMSIRVVSKTMDKLRGRVEELGDNVARLDNIVKKRREIDSSARNVDNINLRLFGKTITDLIDTGVSKIIKAYDQAGEEGEAELENVDVLDMFFENFIDEIEEGSVWLSFTKVDGDTVSTRPAFAKFETLLRNKLHNDRHMHMFRVLCCKSEDDPALDRNTITSEIDTLQVKYLVDSDTFEDMPEFGLLYKNPKEDSISVQTLRACEVDMGFTVKPRSAQAPLALRLQTGHWLGVYKGKFWDSWEMAESID